MTRPVAGVGRVYIVGAGPGDPGLMTVRGLHVLRQAQVVIYDRLVHPSLLEEAPAAAERLDVGKAPGRHSHSQTAINALLIDRARAGNCVVRLKGGDPFVFGRGGEEGQALAAAGIAYEVIPGVSSAVAAPAAAGIPLTYRGLARSVAVVTGHTCRPDDTGVDWSALAHIDTLVILMGLRRLPMLVARLLAEGRAPDTPAAVIRWGTTAEQVVVEGTLLDIADHARHLVPPATVVIGQVVALRHSLQPRSPRASGPVVQTSSTALPLAVCPAALVS